MFNNGNGAWDGAMECSNGFHHLKGRKESWFGLINMLYQCVDRLVESKYRRSQYQTSTSLHKYEVKLFSATFLEHENGIFDREIVVNRGLSNHFVVLVLVLVS